LFLNLFTVVVVHVSTLSGCVELFKYIRHLASVGLLFHILSILFILFEVLLIAIPVDGTLLLRLHIVRMHDTHDLIVVRQDGVPGEVFSIAKEGVKRMDRAKE
jgi:hypothetical protein